MSKTDKTNMNIDYRSPATFLDERQGWDRNIEFIDYSYLTILEGLEKINDKFSASIKLDEEQKGD